MKKILLIGIPILLVIVSLLYIFIFRNKTTTDQSNTGATTTNSVSLPPSTPSINTNKATDPTTKLENASGEKLLYDSSSGKITVDNFAKNGKIAPNGVIYFADKNNYNIGYNSTSKEFIITLLVKINIESARKEAESDLLSSLGIAKEDACKLKVFLYVSAALTTDNSLSQNHGLSFCPGSKFFPN